MNAIRSMVMVAALVAAAGAAWAADEPGTLIYSVKHELVVKDLPAGAKKLRVWFWLPQDTRQQKVLDANLTSAPAGAKITREPVYGNRYVYAEVENPTGKIQLATDILIQRDAVHVALDAAKAGPISDSHRVLYAADLDQHVPNMESTDAMKKLADSICGSETNVVKQARALYDNIVSTTNHYSKPGAPKSSQIGSAEYCLSNKGGACTDQHSLFIAMARARGIPTRLHFGSRLQAKNESKDHDPGYRCWVEYFVPGYGWVPTDISAGNTNPEMKDFYFSGLDARRMEFAEGRNLDLEPKQAGGPLNLMIVSYVEVDGKPYTATERHVTFKIQ